MPESVDFCRSYICHNDYQELQCIVQTACSGFLYLALTGWCCVPEIVQIKKPDMSQPEATHTTLPTYSSLISWQELKHTDSCSSNLWIISRIFKPDHQSPVQPLMIMTAILSCPTATIPGCPKCSIMTTAHAVLVNLCSLSRKQKSF